VIYGFCQSPVLGPISVIFEATLQSFASFDEYCRIPRDIGCMNAYWIVNSLLRIYKEFSLLTKLLI